MHTQNSQVENMPIIVITFEDSRILKWRRPILTRLPNGKLNDKLIRIGKKII